MFLFITIVLISKNGTQIKFNLHFLANGMIVMDREVVVSGTQRCVSCMFCSTFMVLFIQDFTYLNRMLVTTTIITMKGILAVYGSDICMKILA